MTITKTYSKLTRLDLSWAVSRGAGTYGYNIARLDDSITGKRYRTCGGGYDMVGTVFADWMNVAHQDKLQALFTGATQECGYSVPGYKKLPALYGVTLSPKGIAHCDGGCGIESMRRIAEAIGLEVQSTYNRKGRTTGFIVGEVLTTSTL